MHFALFYRTADSAHFDEGIRANTTVVCEELQELASIYSLAKGVSVLDFGCGTGDLLVALADSLLVKDGVGIDLSDSAIAIATSNCKAFGQNQSSLMFRVGDVGSLAQEAERGAVFDIIICRDMYYLLDESEQHSMLSSFAALLKPGGVVYLADLAVERGSLPLVQDALIARQHGGNPITWTIASQQMTFSLHQQATSHGLKLVREPDVLGDVVAESYQSAAAFASPATRAAFLALSKLASTKVNGRSLIPYARFFFRKDLPVSNENACIGLCLEEDVTFPKRPAPVLAAGTWLVPSSKWSLILGRSGSGKSTFLNLLAGLIKNGVTKRLMPASTSIFLLSQDPLLIEELSIEENIKLYARDPGKTSQILQVLGFQQKIGKRLADQSLSGGEAQRVALGQAIAAEPDLLLLDEPTSGVDLVRKRQFFVHLKRGLTEYSPTVVCVDHEFLSIEEYFDEVFEIIDGVLVTMSRR